MALPERFFTTTALGFTPGFQPAMVPSSVTKRKIDFTFGATGNAVVGLKTAPVAGEVPLPSGVRILTTRDWGTPVALYKVERPVPLSATHQGLVLARASPHAFTRLGSTLRLAVLADTEDMSAVRSVRLYFCAMADPGNNSANVKTNRTVLRATWKDIPTPLAFLGIVGRAGHGRRHPKYKRNLVS